MSEKTDVVRVLNDIADLLDLSGERFKPEAYRRAARSIEALPDDLRRVLGRGELEEIPGVGEAISEKIKEFLGTGKLHYLDELRKRFPPGILELMQLPGIGPKTARRFLVELGIQGPAELRTAIDEGRLNGVFGFGPKKIELFRAALSTTSAPAGRVPLAHAFAVAQEIIEGIRKAGHVDRIEMAGSYRRSRETVGDLDVLVTSDHPVDVITNFTKLPGVTEIRLQGDTRSTVMFRDGLQIDLRVVEPASFGAAWQYFTGNKDHNVHLRSIARDRGLKINEYGIYRGEERLGGATEEEVYDVLGMPWMPPEIRENHGEIEAALEHRLPTLLALTDLKGDLHVHLSARTKPAEVDRCLERGRELHFEYLGFVVSGTDPPSAAIAGRLQKLRRTPPAQGPKVLCGEARRSLLAKGEELPGTADYWLWDPREGGTRASATAGPPPLALVHGDLAALMDGPNAGLPIARDLGAAVEVTADGPGDGLDSNGVSQARGQGVPILVSAGGEFTAPGRTQLALGFARRGWAGPSDVLNTRPFDRLWSPPPRRKKG
jgi:DNA polymerase (family 10)